MDCSYERVNLEVWYMKLFIPGLATVGLSIDSGLTFEFLLVLVHTWPSLLKKVTTTLGFCLRTSSPVSSIILPPDSSYFFHLKSSWFSTFTFEVLWQFVSTFFISLKHTEDLSLQINNTRGDLYNSRIRLDYWLDGGFGPRSAWVCRGWWELKLWCLKDNNEDQKNVWSPIYEIKWGTCSGLMASLLEDWSQKVDFVQLLFHK